LPSRAGSCAFDLAEDASQRALVASVTDAGAGGFLVPITGSVELAP
jgi:hypothetical protein